jgi:hypothetical protein
MCLYFPPSALSDRLHCSALLSLCGYGMCLAMKPHDRKDRDLARTLPLCLRTEMPGGTYVWNYDEVLYPFQTPVWIKVSRTFKVEGVIPISVEGSRAEICSFLNDLVDELQRRQLLQADVDADDDIIGDPNLAQQSAAVTGARRANRKGALLGTTKFFDHISDDETAGEFGGTNGKEAEEEEADVDIQDVTPATDAGDDGIVHQT